MSNKYTQHYSTRETPQTEPISGTNQVQNEAGGYSFAIDKWKQLDRFLILGTDGGTFYASEHDLTVQNATAVSQCLDEDGPRTVNRIVEVSDKGLAAKNSPALFALALAAGHKDKATRKAAMEALPKVARTATHLFEFLDAVQHFRGWGRLLKWGVKNWYQKHLDDDTLAYQVIKYRSREGWTHRDAIRLSHPKSSNNVVRWAAGLPILSETAHPLITAFVDVQKADVPIDMVLSHIRKHRLPREALPTELLNRKDVWEALLEQMPMTAMLRNLATMTRVGLLAPMSDASRTVCARLLTEASLHRARIHPIAVLIAQITYAQGHSIRGRGEGWTPVPQVVDALDDAFYMAFQNVEPTGKRWMLGMDVSGSMGMGAVSGVAGLTPRVASAAMAMVVARTEKDYMALAFSHQIVPFPLSAKQRLDDVCQQAHNIPFGGTDCSLPIWYALKHRIPVDVFAVYTDSETWAGDVHPVQVLRRYRNEMGIPARMVVVGMTSNGFSIADPEDGGMLDVVGFSADTPAIMAAFARGDL